MSRFWVKYREVIWLFLLWRLTLFLIEWASPFIWPLRSRFLGPVVWANMDGAHYLLIAQQGYGIYEQAFFPLYPLLIRLFSFLPTHVAYIGLGISHIAFFFGIMLCYTFFKEMGSQKKSALWGIIFILFFPTSFFFASSYPTSLLFLLLVSTSLAAHKKKWLLAGIAGMFASATSLFGIFIFPVVLWEYFKVGSGRVVGEIVSICLIPFGFISYMTYLWITKADPLYFVHVQPEFGANRIAGIILFPQVAWRYIKIFMYASPQTIEYVVAFFEFIIFLLFLFLLVKAIKIKLSPAYIFYSSLVLFIPSLTGTLSSVPRYVLAIFPLFFVLGTMHNKTGKILLLLIFILGLVFCASAFLRGYFIA